MFKKGNKYCSNRKGTKNSKKHRKKISKTLNILYDSDQGIKVKEKMSNNAKRQFKNGMPENTKNKLRKLALKQFKDGMSKKTKKKISKSLKGLNTWSKGKKHTKKVKDKISESSKKRWENPEYAKKVLKSFRNSPNKAEQKLNKIINDILPTEYKFVGDGEFILGGKCPDFLNINGKKKLIELYGNYWHQNDNPKDRIDYFKKFGFETLIIWENELNNVRIIEKRIINFTK